jgi:hypothetical protein
MATGHPDWQPVASSSSSLLVADRYTSPADILPVAPAGYRYLLRNLVAQAAAGVGPFACIIDEVTPANVVVRHLTDLIMGGERVLPVNFEGLPIDSANKVRLTNDGGGGLRLVLVYTLVAV